MSEQHTELKETIHTLRKQIDSVTNNVIALKDNPVAAGVAGRNIAICITHLEDAKMRLGKALGDIGSELPAEFADKASTESTPTVPAAPAQPMAQANPQATPVQPNVAPVTPTEGAPDKGSIPAQ